MAYAYNPQTGQFEDENGNAKPAVSLDQMQPQQGNPLLPGALAANNRAGVDLSQPMSVIPPGESMPATLPQQAPVVTEPPPPVAPPPTPATLSQTTVTREKPTKGEADALGRVQQDYTAAAGTARQEGDLLARNAAAEAGGAKDTFEATQKREQQLAAEQEKRNAAIQAAQAKVEADRATYEAERKKLAGMEPKDMYEGKPGLLIGKAIALALGQFGAALAHTGNGAAEVIAANERAWYNLQAAKIEKQRGLVGEAKDAMALSQQGVGAARQSKQDALSDLTLAAAARADTIATQVRAQVAATGTEQAKIAGEKIAQSAELLRDQYFAKYQEGLRAHVSTVSAVREGGAGGAGGAGGSGRAFGRQSDLALFGTEVEKNTAAQDALGLSHAQKLEALRKVQDNETSLKRVEHDSSLTGAGVTFLGRAAGVVPRSRLDGLTPAQKQWVAFNDVGEKKTATLLEKSTAPSAQHSALDRIALNPDDTPESMAQKLEERRRIARETVAMAGATGQIAQRAAGGAGVAPGEPYTGPAPRAVPGPAQMSTQDQAAIAWAKSHPNDPRSRQILALHGM